MFTPKKIGASSAIASRYYADEFHREDYYAKGKEPPGVWVGGQSLGLHGEQVNSVDLKLIFEGKNQKGEALVQGAGERHAPGWDMPFSAPKSVSVLWGTSDEKTREIIASVHEKAVDSALQFLKEHSLSDASRRGKGGLRREAPEEIICAKFQHGTSRDHDPQLHTHVLLLNVAKRSDGSWGALQPDGIYRDVKLISSLYRAELAAGLREELGILMERDGAALRVAGFDKKVEKFFSKRRNAIEELLGERGQDGLKAASNAALVTRSRKKEVDRSVLMESWKGQAQEMSFSPEQAIQHSRTSGIHKLNQLSRDGQSFEKTVFESISLALSNLSEGQSTFTKHKLFEAIALDLQGQKTIKEIRDVFETALTHPEILALNGRDKSGEELFTTRSIREVEERLISQSLEMSNSQTKQNVSLEVLKER